PSLYHSPVSSEPSPLSLHDALPISFLYNFRVSAETIRAMAVSPDEKVLAFACKDSLVRIYDADTYSLQHELNGHTMPVTSVAFRSEEHTSELQSRFDLVCRLLLAKK